MQALASHGWANLLSSDGVRNRCQLAQLPLEDEQDASEK